MVLFFKTKQCTVLAVQLKQQPTGSDIEKLCWLFGKAEVVAQPTIAGRFIGPRREMVTPWSTNAVEITQNMGIDGIVRIEEFFAAATTADGKETTGYDPMLQRSYDNLDQQIFSVDIKPEPIREVTDIDTFNEQEGLALSPEEIAYLHQVEQQNKRPLTDSEVFGFAQINSEHCRHKIFGGTFVIDGVEQESSLFQMIKRTTQENPGHILSAYKDNVAFAEGPTVEQFAPTDQSTSDWFAVKQIESVISLKAETHNFPTTVEPFNGAATGTGGEIRDRMGGGVGSWPIAGTAVYMTSRPEGNRPETDHDNSTAAAIKPRKWLYQSPDEILIKASNGASDFGNKFGQPLITGSVLTFEHQEAPASSENSSLASDNSAQTDLSPLTSHHSPLPQTDLSPLTSHHSPLPQTDLSPLPSHHSPLSTPLYAYDKVIMLAGGVGYGTRRDCLKKEPQQGNKVVVVGGDNYRIGLGGGSVSSVDTGRYASGIELNAIQRANPEMQKRAYNLIRALCEGEANPVVSIHDHGSAGHLNCLSELVEDCGGEIDMASLPIGDPTLSAKEIIANESQERMGLLIDSQHLDYVKRIAERERAPMYVVGQTTGDAHFSFVQADGKRPFDLDVAQMFGHSPKTVMTDTTTPHHYSMPSLKGKTIEELLHGVLGLEAVACKDWLTNKVDRSVTGRIARQQCQGELQLPLSDCGVVALDYQGHHGIATALGHAPQAGLASPEAGSVLSVAESLTNLVWAPIGRTGKADEDPFSFVSLSANWMWPCRSQQGEDARLYAAVKALSDFCVELGVNVPTGKDSLSMTQKYPDGQKVIAPGTVIVNSGAEVYDVRRTVSPVIVNDKRASLYHIDFSFCEQRLGGSAMAQSLGYVGSDVPTVSSASYFADAFTAVQELIRRGWVMAGHDISAGGLITCLLEMCFANTSGGLHINLHDLLADKTDESIVKALFSENPGVVIQVSDDHRLELREYLESMGVGFAKIGYAVPDSRSIEIVGGAENSQLLLDIDHWREVWYAPSSRLDAFQSRNGKAQERKENYSRQPVEIRLPRLFSGQLSQYGLDSHGLPAKTERKVKAAIIREKGTNGDREMAWSLYQAGFAVKDVTMTDLISGRELLDDVQMIVFCGGFSNSDVLGSAKGWAGAILYNDKARETIQRFYSRKDTLSLGICNGCQLMVELGLIGNQGLCLESDAATSDGSALATSVKMAHNDSHKFESAYLSLAIPENNSIMLSSLSGSKLGIWVAHGEGKFVVDGKESDYNIVAKYNYSGYPANPNGSAYDIAGLCSADGRHLAMMPHLERALYPWQCAWYPENRRQDEVTPWIEAFVNARRWSETVHSA